jgi:hypothetical protein
MPMTSEGVERSRIWRSKEARAVRDALLAQVMRATLVGFNAGKLRHGKMQFTVLYKASRSYRMLLDVDASTLIVSGLLPEADEQSSLWRDLRQFLKSCATLRSATAPQLDRTRGEIRLVADRAGTAVAMQVKNAEYQYCATYLVDLADAIGRVVLLDDRRYPLIERQGVTLSAHG